MAKLFTCPDGTVFMLKHITHVEPLVEPGLPFCPARFLVYFVGGGVGSFPAADDYLRKDPTFDSKDSSSVAAAIVHVRKMRENLIEALKHPERFVDA
jgi:hypothetical protein